MAPFEAKANEVLEQVKQDPQHVDEDIERHMPYFCQEHTLGTHQMETP